MPPEIPLKIIRGKTFAFGMLYAEDELLYLPIGAMSNLAPVRLQITGHGVPDGWPVRIECVPQPEEMNTPPDSYVTAKVIDADNIEINSLNAYCWPPYSAGGLVVLRKPMDLTGWSCRAQVRDRVGGVVLFSWHSDPLEQPDGNIEVNVAKSAFILQIDAATTAALTWNSGIYDAEAISPTGEVYPLNTISPVSVLDEVTT